ncbi:MAG TPA: YraN family protein [Armatimonadota bacterium]|jgi:putative endonuclease
MERAARRELRRRGYRILECNVFWAHGEIDIFARHGSTLVVAEVRSYKQGGMPPRQTLSADKRRRLRRFGEQWHARSPYRHDPLRLDLVEVMTDDRHRVIGIEILAGI